MEGIVCPVNVMEESMDCRAGKSVLGCRKHCCRAVWAFG